MITRTDPVIYARTDLVIMTFFQYYLELSNILCIFAPKYR